MPGCGEVQRSTAEAAEGTAVIAIITAQAPARHRESYM